MVRVVEIEKVDKRDLYLKFDSRRDRDEFHDFVKQKMKEGVR